MDTAERISIVPGFQSMIAEIEAGHIATVIVKDMSRFGRNYLEVGFYTENSVSFKECSVHRYQQQC